MTFLVIAVFQFIYFLLKLCHVLHGIHSKNDSLSLSLYHSIPFLGCHGGAHSNMVGKSIRITQIFYKLAIGIETTFFPNSNAPLLFFLNAICVCVRPFTRSARFLEFTQSLSHAYIVFVSIPHHINAVLQLL